jgi:hypothetical protein
VSGRRRTKTREPTMATSEKSMTTWQPPLVADRLHDLLQFCTVFQPLG